MNTDTVTKLVESRNARFIEEMESSAASIISKIARAQEDKHILDEQIAKLRTELLALKAQQHSVAEILGEPTT